MVPSASSKYYVYGGGRWRELDTVTGRVSGWRGARLCVARRGRLATQHGARRRRVLAALRVLAARPGPGAADTDTGMTARDGPPLQSKSPRSARCRCRCCCHNNNNKDDNRCGGKSPPSVDKAPLTSDACVQAAAPERSPRPRLAFPTLAGRHLTTVATIHHTPMETRNTSTPIGSGKKQNSSSTSSTSWKHDHESSSGSTESPVTNASPRKKANLSLKRKRTNSESSGISKDEISISQSILKKDFNAKYSRARKAEDRPPPRVRTRLVQRDVIDVSSDDETKDPTVDLSSTEKETEETESEEVVTKHRQKGQKIQDKMDIYRELVISEDDVDILRRFMIKNNPKFDLYKYDNDDKYKARFFYSINPLVSIEPCPRIFAMLEGQDGLSLQEFASQLGLRSVSDGASSSGRAPPRKRRRPPPKREDTETPDSEDKENLETTVGQSNRDNITKEKDKHNTEDRKKLKDMTDVTVSLERIKDDDGQRRRNRGRSPERNIRGENMHRDNLKRSRDDSHLKDERRKRQKQQETEAEGMKLVHEGNHSDKQKVITEKRVNGAPPVVQAPPEQPAVLFWSKEYSSIEDHAIVKWISSGDRAKLVNGNRVWMLLEQSYEEIAGRARTWHSLRNRYLRHLLPRLGHLELPETQQARLRAAAAQGEIKGKKMPQKRNSIYGEPVRGASSRDLRRSPRQPAPARAPAAAPSPARAPSAARVATPRYSDVTRQFAARHPVSSSSEFEVESPARTRSRTSNPQTRSPGPLTRKSNPQTRNPGPLSQTSNPQTRNPGPLSRTSNPQTRSPGPLSRTSNPQTRSPGPLSRTSNPQTPGPKSGSRTRKLYNPNKL